MNSSNANNKNILIVDDDVNTSSKYKKWLEEEEGFNLTLINDPDLAEKNFNPENYDLVLIGFRMSVMDGFDLYTKLHDLSKKSTTRCITVKRFSNMFYDCIKNKLSSVGRYSSRIWRRMLCFQRCFKRCFYKSCPFTTT
jgi:DNA-binding NtrC family response regulator